MQRLTHTPAVIEYPGINEGLDTWLTAQLSANRGKSLFVVGHSNTVPQMVNILMGPNSTLPDLEETDFGNFFVVASRNIGDSEYLWRQY